MMKQEKTEMYEKYLDPVLSAEERADDLLAKMSLDEKFAQTQCGFAAVSYTHLGKQSADGVDFRHYKRCPLSVFSESAESDQRRDCKKHPDPI